MDFGKGLIALTLETKIGKCSEKLRAVWKESKKSGFNETVIGSNDILAAFLVGVAKPDTDFLLSFIFLLQVKLADLGSRIEGKHSDH